MTNLIVGFFRGLFTVLGLFLLAYAVLLLLGAVGGH